MARAVPPQWRRKIEARLVHLEERIRREVRTESEAREKDGAHTDEEIQALEERLDALAEEQKKLEGRLSWIERRMPIRGRPPKDEKK